jgi:DNA-binding Lrp family transcriptional regulator
MVSAYCLIRVKRNKIEHVFDRIRRANLAKEVLPVYGEYDLWTTFEAESLRELDDFVYGFLRPIPGVETTTTMIHANLSKRKQ